MEVEMVTTKNLEIRISVDADGALYSLWFAVAATQALAGVSTPLHQVMVDAGLWTRKRYAPNAKVNGGATEKGNSDERTL
jgi:hypothetical protein